MFEQRAMDSSRLYERYLDSLMTMLELLCPFGLIVEERGGGQPALRCVPETLCVLQNRTVVGKCSFSILVR